MIYWIFGNTQSGKSTFAKKFIQLFNNAILLDGDDMRNTISKDLGLSKQDREKNNERIMNLAKLLHLQGFTIVVATICPYEKLRKRIYSLTNCRFIYITGGKKGKEYPFEKPFANVFFTVEGNKNG